MAEGYGWYTPKNFDDYVDEMIGAYNSELRKMTFTDRRQTTYLEAIKYNAELIWNEYNIKQQKDTKLALVNTDVLNDALLSLHPAELLKDKDISENSRMALKAISKFRDLILLKDYSKEEVETWIEVATSMNYSAQLCLMGWFLTLASKMTGFKIPGVKKMLVGGRIQKQKNETMKHLSTMEYIADAMYKNNYWNYLAQYSILKEMHKDLKTIIKKF